MLAGIGMGLVMTPMPHAAVMYCRAPASGPAWRRPPSNASREIGGVFGIALLGAIVTRIFSRDLRASIAALPLPAQVKAAIVRQASRGAEQAATALPHGVDSAALHALGGAAFVSGMHAAMVVAAVALASGAVAAAVLMRGGRPQQVEAGAPAPGAGRGGPSGVVADAETDGARA